MNTIVNSILNGKNIREALWGDLSVDNDVESIKMELKEVGFLYGNPTDSFMYSKDTGFGGNKLYAVVSPLCVDSINDLLRVEISVNSYPEDSNICDGFRFSCLIPREQAHVCKAYLERLLRKVKHSEAYINNSKPKIVKGVKDTDIGVGVLVVKGDDILIGTRTDGKGLCGPGGGVHLNESIKDAAIRETEEEFGITPLNLEVIGRIEIVGHKPSYIFKTDSYKGEISSDNKEIVDPCWVNINDLLNKEENLFEPFKRSLDFIV